MDDLESYSNEELLRIAGIQQPQQQPTYDPSYIETLGNKIGEGLTFGFKDEIVGAVAKNLFGGDYEQAKRAVQARQQAMSEKYPITSFIGEGVGSATTAGVGTLALPASATATMATAPLTTAAGVGALSGGLYAAGGREGTMAEKGQAALSGAALGAPLGVGGAFLARQAVPAAGALYSRARKLFPKRTPQPTGQMAVQDIVEQVAAQSDLSPEVADSQVAFKKVGQRLRQDVGSLYDEALQAYKQGEISLSDFYGARSTSLAKGAAQYPSGQAVAQREIGKKIAGSSDRVIDAIRANVSGIDNYYTNADDLLNAGRLKASPLYKEAYDLQITPSQKLQDLLSRPSGQAALENAKRIAADEGVDISQDNTFMVYDYVKRGFDDIISGYKDSTTGRLNLDARGRAVEGLRKEFVSELKNLNPAYKKALDVSGDYLSINAAMNKGTEALRGGKMDSGIVQRYYKALTQPEKDAYKVGLGKAIRDKINKVRDTSNPYTAVLGTKDKRERIQAVLSPVEYKNFERSLKAEDRLFRFRNEVLGGSPTASKQEAKKAIESGAIQSIANVPEATFIKAFQTFKTKMFEGINDRTAQKISEILYETDPIKKLEIIEKLGSSKALTSRERDLVKKGYALLAPRFDALNATNITGAAATGQMAGGQ